MDKSDALTALAALSQPMRLDVFRLLVKAGPDGMRAGDLATALDARANTLSANLAILLNAGLVVNERQGRGIRYRADMDRMGALLGFLMEDCCGGHPERCRPIIEELAC